MADEQAPQTDDRAEAIAQIDKMLNDEQPVETEQPEQPEAVEQPEETQEPQEPEIPADLYDAARRVGITKSQVRAMGEDATRAMVERWSRPTQEPESKPEPKAQQPEQPKSAAQRAAEFTLENADSLDPDTRANIQRLYDHIAPGLKRTEEVAGRLETLESTLSQVTQFIGHVQEMQARQQHADAIARFDRVLDSMGEDWHEVFGKGQSHTLDRNSQQFKNRDELADLVGAMFPAGEQIDPKKYERVVRGLAVGQFEEHATKVRQRQQAARVARSSDGRWQSSAEARTASPKATVQPQTTREDFARALAKELNIPSGV